MQNHRFDVYANLLFKDNYFDIEIHVQGGKFRHYHSSSIALYVHGNHVFLLEIVSVRIWQRVVTRITFEFQYEDFISTILASTWSQEIHSAFDRKKTEHVDQNLDQFLEGEQSHWRWAGFACLDWIDIFRFHDQLQNARMTSHTWSKIVMNFQCLQSHNYHYMTRLKRFSGCLWFYKYRVNFQRFQKFFFNQLYLRRWLWIKINLFFSLLYTNQLKF